jgi:hydrogenase maturation protein HypF
MRLIKIPLPFKVKTPVLALGSHTKNTVCLIRGDSAYVSPVHQDLSTPKDFSDFVKHTKYFLKNKPRIITCDLHPEYQSTKYAHELAAVRCPCLAGRQALSAVQHHHAHIAACMAEVGLKNRQVIGVAFDGTGLGSDGRIWGAEFLICDYKEFQRRAHLKEIPLLGGEQAVLEPWRLILAWLYQMYNDRALRFKIGPLRPIGSRQRKVLRKMYLSGFNAPLASSMGRLFDAVASLVLSQGKAHFEAELAIALEKAAQAHKSSRPSAYKFRITKVKDSYIIDPRPMFRQIIAALKTQSQKEEIAFRFHCTVAQMVSSTCSILRKESRINRIVLSGGVFQNKLLLKETLDLLYKDKFEVFIHTKLPCNDACVSLGQALVAYCREG